MTSWCCKGWKQIDTVSVAFAAFPFSSRPVPASLRSLKVASHVIECALVHTGHVREGGRSVAKRAHKIKNFRVMKTVAVRGADGGNCKSRINPLKSARVYTSRHPGWKVELVVILKLLAHHALLGRIARS